MKILWVKTDFLHPTDRGGQIRTLEILKRLHRKHEVHYLAYDHPRHPDALARSQEYCYKAYPVSLEIPQRRSVGFAWQLLENLASSLPLAVSRYRSVTMRTKVEELLRGEQFDSIVCDFLFPAPHFRDLGRVVLFQHNVEQMIWHRHAETAKGPMRWYFARQAERMFRYEGSVCRAVRNVIAVSEDDAALFQSQYGCRHVSVVPTGVDVDHFTRQEAAPIADLVFVGSMDWLPNIDAMRYFFADILPLIRAQRPATTVAIVGRKPGKEVYALAEGTPGITVTGTVPDVRPYLWGSAVSIVPLRIGGGTRLKIYEAIAAGLPVVSTTIGAEGLGLRHPHDILLGDTPQAFAGHCLHLLQNPHEHRRIRDAAWQLVKERYSWEQVTLQFEQILQQERTS